LLLLEELVQGVGIGTVHLKLVLRRGSSRRGRETHARRRVQLIYTVLQMTHAIHNTAAIIKN
jgi:hypothetical protein